MTFAFLVAAFLSTAGPARLRPALVTLAVGAGAIAVADPLLDVLAISPESWRIAAGLVLAAAGLWTLVRPAPDRPLLPPDVLAVAVAAGADEPMGKAVGALAVALVAAVALRAAPAPAYAARVLGGLEVAIGVALVVAGVRDV